jgi:hypothetical protein
MAALAAEPGPLGKRARKITGNPKLYDVVQDMADAVDKLVLSDRETHIKLDTIINLLRTNGKA